MSKSDAKFWIPLVASIVSIAATIYFVYRETLEAKQEKIALKKMNSITQNINSNAQSI